MQVWQSRSHCLQEIAIVHILDIALSFSSVSVGLRLLIVGFVLDRLRQLANKLYVFLAVLVASWTDKKHRRTSTLPWIITNLVLFPIVVVLLTVATCLSAPLLPLFTLPIFLIGFPRPSRYAMMIVIAIIKNYVLRECSTMLQYDMIDIISLLT